MVDTRVYFMFHCLCIIWLLFTFIKCKYVPDRIELVLVVLFAPMIVVGSFLMKFIDNERR